MKLNLIIKLTIGITLFLLMWQGVIAQTITGTLSQSANKTILLQGFHGLKNYNISSNTIDANGNFNLSYSTNDYGVGALQIEGEKPFIVLLTGEDIQLNGNSLNEATTIHISKGKENQSFERYAQEQPKREQALSAWGYLENVYTLDSFFAKQTKPIAAIQQ